MTGAIIKSDKSWWFYFIKGAVSVQNNIANCLLELTLKVVCLLKKTSFQSRKKLTFEHHLVFTRFRILFHHVFRADWEKRRTRGVAGWIAEPIIMRFPHHSTRVMYATACRDLIHTRPVQRSTALAITPQRSIQRPPRGRGFGFHQDKTHSTHNHYLYYISHEIS